MSKAKSIMEKKSDDGLGFQKSVCKQPVVKSMGVGKDATVTCEAQIHNVDIMVKACPACGQMEGMGHAGPECVIGGQTRYEPFRRQGVRCDDGHWFQAGD